MTNNKFEDIAFRIGVTLFLICATLATSLLAACIFAVWKDLLK